MDTVVERSEKYTDQTRNVVVAKLKNKGYQVKETKASDEELLQLWEQFEDLETVTEEAGYQPSSKSWVKKRLEKLGVKFKPIRRKTLHSDQELIDLWNKHQDLEKIAEETTYYKDPSYIKKRLEEATDLNFNKDRENQFLGEERLAYLYYVEDRSLKDLVEREDVKEEVEELKSLLGINGKKLDLRRNNSKKVGKFYGSLFSISEEAVKNHTDLDFEDLEARVVIKSDSITVNFS